MHWRRKPKRLGVTMPICPDPAGEADEVAGGAAGAALAPQGSSRLLSPQPRPQAAPSREARRLHAAGSPLLLPLLLPLPLLLAGCSAGMAAHSPRGDTAAASERPERRALIPHSRAIPAEGSLNPPRHKNARFSFAGKPVVSRDFRLPARFGPRLTRFRRVSLGGPPLRFGDAR
ncbi:hypothetical protein NN561_007320 [Cricetulus griseus]